MASKTVYCGNLPADVRRSEVEDLFAKYGKIRDVDLKVPTRPPAFAFVEFDSSRDAEDAVRGRDGYNFDGSRLRVEIAQGGGRRRGGFGMGGGRGGGFGGGFGGPPPFGGGGFGGGGGNRGGVSRQTGYRLEVTGLPKSASWQDLKDTCRRYGDVTFTQVMRDSKDRIVGIVDFATKDDMKYALRKLDDTEFKNPFERSYIRVREDRGRSRSRSRSRGRSHSRSRSRSRSSRSRSRSRSYSSRSRSRSSRSKSRSKSKSRGKSRSRSKSHSRSASPAKSRSRSASPAANGANDDAEEKSSPADN